MRRFQSKFTVTDEDGTKRTMYHFGESESSEEFLKKARVAIRENWSEIEWPTMTIEQPVDVTNMTTRRDVMQASVLPFQSWQMDAEGWKIQRQREWEIHRQYYGEIARAANMVGRWNEKLLDEVEDAIERGDKHLNGLPSFEVDYWNRTSLQTRPFVEPHLNARGDFWSYAGGVCVAKEAARIAVEERQARRSQ